MRRGWYQAEGIGEIVVVPTNFHVDLIYSQLVPFWYYWRMPSKLRILIKALRAAGFELRRTRGSHRQFGHPNGQKVWLSGKNSADSHHYQVKQVREIIASVKDEKK